MSLLWEAHLNPSSRGSLQDRENFKILLISHVHLTNSRKKKQLTDENGVLKTKCFKHFELPQLSKGLDEFRPLLKYASELPTSMLANTHQKFITLSPSKKESKHQTKMGRNWKKKKNRSDGPNLQFENGDALHSHELACTSRIYLKTKLFGTRRCTFMSTNERI